MRISPPDLHSHVLVITGGSRGIGAAVVRQAARSGAQVCFSYLRDRDAAEALCAELAALGARVSAFQGDIADADFATKLLDAAQAAHGPVTLLVHNVGLAGRHGPVPGPPAETMDRTLDVNVIGGMILSQEANRRWRASGIRGRAVNISRMFAGSGASLQSVAKPDEIACAILWALTDAPADTTDTVLKVAKYKGA